VSRRWQTVRVFISSTFRDMQAEREALVKEVFPSLRERLERQRLHLLDIDLRWGIPEEQARGDPVLELCLEQVAACRPVPGEPQERPFFLGVLGQRFGWVPATLRTEAARRFPWLAEQWAHGPWSITALEALFARHLAPQAGGVFFYFRDPGYLTVARERLAALRRDGGELLREEVGWLEGTFLGGVAEQAHAQRLEDLKALLRTASDESGGSLVVRDYACDWEPAISAQGPAAPGRVVGLRSFAEQVHEDLWSALVAAYPALGLTPPALRRSPDTPAEAAEETEDDHARFAEMRRELYVDRPALEMEVHSHLGRAASPPILVSGPPGAGKSALIARICSDLEAGNAFLISHFVGAGPRSSDLVPLLQRVCRTLRAELRRLAAAGTGNRDATLAELGIPEDVAGLGHTLAILMKAVPTGRQVVIVLDALDQLDASGAARQLHWLPFDFPDPVRLVVSCADDEHRGGGLLRLLRRRGVAEVRVPPLRREEQLAILRRVPALWAKNLAASQVESLLSNPAAKNPLFLRVALEELRGFGSHEGLDRRIAALPCGAGALTGIFRQVLERLEDDFGAPLARSLLAWLGVCRIGLSERDLRTLLAGRPTGGEDALQPLLRQLRAYLLRRGELLDFYHQNLREAVEERYLAVPAERTAAHEAVAGLLEAEIDPGGDRTFAGPLRALRELPFHLDAAQEESSSAKLLILARAGFPERKLERTHDRPEADRDSIYFFRACLRTRDLPGALRMAQMRAGFGRLGSWLLEPAMAPLLAQVGAGSTLFAKIKAELSGLPTADERIDRASDLLHPGLPPEAFSLFRAQFDHDAPDLSDAARLKFLNALAASEAGGLPFLLDQMLHAPPDATLVCHVIERCLALASGRRDEVADRLDRLADLAATEVDLFASAATAWTRVGDADLAREGLEALALRLADLEGDRFRGLATAALSVAFSDVGAIARAEELAHRALRQVPECSADEDWENMLFASTVSRTALALARAAAPFPQLWQTALPMVRSLAARAVRESPGGYAERAEQLAESVLLAPRIADPQERSAWIHELMNEIRSVADTAATDPDPVLRLRAVFGGDEPQAQLARSLSQSLIEALGAAHRLMASETDLGNLLPIVATFVHLHRLLPEEEQTLLGALGEVCTALAGSPCPPVVVFAFEVLIETVQEQELYSKQAGRIFEDLLARALQGGDGGDRVALAGGALASAESAWCPQEPQMSWLLCAALLGAVRRTRSAALFDRARPRLDTWRRQLARRPRDYIDVLTASTLIALGRRPEAERLLHDIRGDGGHGMPKNLRRNMALALLEGGATREAAELLGPDLPAAVALTDPEEVLETLRAAGPLLHTEEHEAARRLLVGAAVAYRKRRDKNRGIESALLNAFAELADPETTSRLLGQAEEELLRGGQTDSATAAQWYATLALSSIGAYEPAQRLWYTISDWSGNRRLEDLRIAILRAAKLAPLSGGDNALDEIERLVREMLPARATGGSGPGTAKSLSSALCLLCHLIPFCAGGEPERIFALLGEGLACLLEDPLEATDLLEALAGVPAHPDLQAPMQRIVEQTLGVLGARGRPVPEGAEGWVGPLLRHALALLSRHAGSDSLPAALAHVIDRAALAKHPPDLLLSALDKGLARAAGSAGPQLLGEAVTACRRIEDPDRRGTALLAIAVRAVTFRIGEVELLTRIFQELDDAGSVQDEQAVAWAKALQSTVELPEARPLAAEAERRLRQWGAPGSLADRALWAAALLGSPLADLARPVAEAMLANLDELARKASSFWAIEPLVQAAASHWRHDGVERFRRIAEWAATMPKVTNEDWRSVAFPGILRASCALPPEIRGPAQLGILEVAFTTSDAAICSRIGECLHEFVRDAAVAARALELCLGREDLGVQEAGERLLTLITANCTKPSDSGREALFDGFDRRLADLAEAPPGADRKRLARAAIALPACALRNRLVSLLRPLYAAPEPATLSSADLELLAEILSDRDDWWVATAPRLRLQDDRADEVAAWVGRTAARAPAAAERCTMAVSFWLSAESADQLGATWFAITTSPAPIPLPIRLALGEALVEARCATLGLERSLPS
jgi:hypothetical protein